TETETETEITETSAIEETSTETAADTKETVAENSDEPENIFENYDKSEFPKGVWLDNYIYTYDRDEQGNVTLNYYDENETNIYSGSFKNYSENDGEPISRKDSHIFEFDGEGRFRAALQTHDVFGEYTFEDNMLTLIFKVGYEGETFINRFCFETSENENGYQLKFMPSKSTEMIELPPVMNMEHIADAEFLGGLSALFDTFYNRKSFCIRYSGETDPNVFKNYELSETFIN
ncbi:MAG: hypothetical protein NC192_08825, partial [Muribaculaceae bacterium]|nr:hypothetical protein [Muribaculaceae bacterium]